MKKSISSNLFIVPAVILLTCIISCSPKEQATPETVSGELMKIGWSTVNITPDQPVDLRGQFPARVSESVLDSVTATVMAIESSDSSPNGHAFIISCDIVAINNDVLVAVREKIKAALTDVNTDNIIIGATPMRVQ